MQSKNNLKKVIKNAKLDLLSLFKIVLKIRLHFCNYQKVVDEMVSWQNDK
jgi:hypothetical protein